MSEDRRPWNFDAPENRWVPAMPARRRGRDWRFMAYGAAWLLLAEIALLGMPAIHVVASSERTFIVVLWPTWWLEEAAIAPEGPARGDGPGREGSRQPISTFFEGESGGRAAGGNPPGRPRVLDDVHWFRGR